MFESLIYDEEGLLVLNLKQIEADYVSGEYKLNPYGKVYVSCPSGYYPLFAYLSRIAGMKDAKKALKKFRAEKMMVLDRESYTTIKLERENELEDLLRRSFYYYYYADADQVRSTDKFLEAFQENVYNNEYDYEAFCAGVDEDVHANPDAWEKEKKAFAHGMNRMHNNEYCDSADAAKEAVKEAAVSFGRTDLVGDDLNRYVYEKATALYYLNCVNIAAERYASPVLALPDFIPGERFVSMPGKLNSRKDANAYATIVKPDIDAIDRFMDDEAAGQALNYAVCYEMLNRSAEKTMRQKRRYVRADEYESVKQNDYSNEYDYNV